MQEDHQQQEHIEDAPKVQKNPLGNLRTLMTQSRGEDEVRLGTSLFWRILLLCSFVLNLMLFLVVFLMGQRLFGFKDSMSAAIDLDLQKSLAGLNTVELSTVVEVEQEIPFSMDVNIQRDTILTLDSSVRVTGATISMVSGGFSVNGPATVELPAGTKLPVQMDLTVPVSATVPASFNVPVTLDLADTSIPSTISSLGAVLSSYEQQISSLPGCWQMLLWNGSCP